MPYNKNTRKTQIKPLVSIPPENIVQTLPPSKVTLKLKKPEPALCCLLNTSAIELNFTLGFLLIRKTWVDRFVGKLENERFSDMGEGS